MPDGNTDTGPKRASSPEADFGAVCWCEGDIAKNRGIRLEGAIRQCRAGASGPSCHLRNWWTRPFAPPPVRKPAE